MEAGEILVRRGLLDERQLELSRDANSDGGCLVDAAVDLGFVTEEEALRAVADEVGLEYVDLRDVDIDLSLTDGKWPEGTNTAALNGVISKLLSLNAVRWVGPAEGKLTDYGLDENLKLSLRVWVENEDGAKKEYGVDIGDRVEDGFYARAWRDGEHEPDVFIAEIRMAEPVMERVKPDADPELVEKGLQVPITSDEEGD